MTEIVMNYWIPAVGRLIRVQSIHVPADLIVACLWAVAGLMVTALVAAGVSIEELAGILAVAE